MSLGDRIRKLEARFGVAEMPPWMQPCPECGNLVSLTIFENRTTDPPTFYPYEPCPTCKKLRAELPPSAPICHIVFVDNSREAAEERR